MVKYSLVLCFVYQPLLSFLTIDTILDAFVSLGVALRFMIYILLSSSPPPS